MSRFLIISLCQAARLGSRPDGHWPPNFDPELNVIGGVEQRIIPMKNISSKVYPQVIDNVRTQIPRRVAFEELRRNPQFEGVGNKVGKDGFAAEARHPLSLRARPNIRQRDIRERHIYIGSLF